VQRQFADAVAVERKGEVLAGLGGLGAVDELVMEIEPVPLHEKDQGAEVGEVGGQIRIKLAEKLLRDAIAMAERADIFGRAVQRFEQLNGRGDFGGSLLFRRHC